MRSLVTIDRAFFNNSHGPVSLPDENTCQVAGSSQTRRSCSTPSRFGRDAIAAAFSAPTEQPTSTSGAMSRSNNACNIPICTAPRLPPPPSTNAVR